MIDVAGRDRMARPGALFEVVGTEGGLSRLPDMVPKPKLVHRSNLSPLVNHLVGARRRIKYAPTCLAYSSLILTRTSEPGGMANDQFGGGGADCACAIGDAREGRLKCAVKNTVLPSEYVGMYGGLTGELHQWEISRIGVISSTV